MEIVAFIAYYQFKMLALAAAAPEIALSIVILIVLAFGLWEVYRD